MHEEGKWPVLKIPILLIWDLTWFIQRLRQRSSPLKRRNDQKTDLGRQPRVATYHEKKVVISRDPATRSSFMQFVILWHHSIVLMDIFFLWNSENDQIGLRRRYYVPTYLHLPTLFSPDFSKSKCCSIFMNFGIGVCWVNYPEVIFLVFRNLPPLPLPSQEWKTPLKISSSSILMDCCEIWHICYLTPYHENYLVTFPKVLPCPPWGGG